MKSPGNEVAHIGLIPRIIRFRYGTRFFRGCYSRVGSTFHLPNKARVEYKPLSRNDFLNFYCSKICHLSECTVEWFGRLFDLRNVEIFAPFKQVWGCVQSQPFNRDAGKLVRLFFSVENNDYHSDFEIPLSSAWNTTINNKYHSSKPIK